MRFSVRGVGVWARGVTGYGAVVAAARNGFLDLDNVAFAAPRPSSIPPRERRRAGLLINLAVEVAHQACDHAGVDRSSINSVFASSMGDTSVTDYMCRKLAGVDRLLSPAKFTNSVHNAASGYWSISANCRSPSTFVGGFDASFGLGLLEAVSQATASGAPVLLVAYDVANEPPLDGVRHIPESLGVGLVIQPETSDGPKGLLTAEIRFLAEPAEPPLPATSGLDALATENPMGAALALIERCTGYGPGDAPLRIPGAPQGCVELRFRASSD